MIFFFSTGQYFILATVFRSSEAGTQISPMIQRAGNGEAERIQSSVNEEEAERAAEAE